MNLIKNYWSEISSEPASFKLTREGNLPELKKFNRGRFGVNTQNFYGNGLLHYSCGLGDIQTTNYFLSRKDVDVNLRNCIEETPLMWACEKGQIEVATLLIDNGADVFKKTSNGDKAIHLAAKKGQCLTCNLLLDRGTAIDDQSVGTGNTALHWALMYGRQELALLLVQRGASLFSHNKANKTPVNVMSKFIPAVFKTQLSDAAIVFDTNREASLEAAKATIERLTELRLQQRSRLNKSAEELAREKQLEEEAELQALELKRQEEEQQAAAARAAEEERIAREKAEEEAKLAEKLAAQKLAEENERIVSENLRLAEELKKALAEANAIKKAAEAATAEAAAAQAAAEEAAMRAAAEAQRLAMEKKEEEHQRSILEEKMNAIRKAEEDAKRAIEEEKERERAREQARQEEENRKRQQAELEERLEKQRIREEEERARQEEERRLELLREMEEKRAQEREAQRLERIREEEERKARLAQEKEKEKMKKKASSEGGRNKSPNPNPSPSKSPERPSREARDKTKNKMPPKGLPLDHDRNVSSSKSETRETKRPPGNYNSNNASSNNDTNPLPRHSPIRKLRSPSISLDRPKTPVTGITLPSKIDKIETDLSIHEVCMMGSLGELKYLLDKGIRVNAKDHNGDTPLHIACTWGNVTCALYLIEKGADTTIKNKAMLTPFDCFSDNINASHRRCLREASDAHDKVVAAHRKAAADELEAEQAAIRLAIQKAKKERDLNRQKDRTPVAIARQRKALQLTQPHLLEKHRLSLGDPTNRIQRAASDGDVDTIRQIIEEKKDHVGYIDSVDKAGASALFYAANGGHTEIIEMLLQAGAKVNRQDHFYQTPLHFACQNGHPTTASRLIELGADTLLQDREGRTPINLINDNTKPSDARKLRLLAVHTITSKAGGPGGGIRSKLKRSLSMKISMARARSDKERITKIINDRVKEKEEMAKRLEEYQKEIDDRLPCIKLIDKERPTTGTNPLFDACTQGSCEAISRHLDRGADVNYQRQSNGWTPIMFACSEGHLPAVQLLLDRGARLDILAKDRKSALHCAAIKGHGEMVSALLEKGMLVNAHDKDGNTALMKASEFGHVDVIQRLLTSGANIDYVRNRDGCSALHCASECGHVEAVKLLVSRGANVNRQDRFGSSPLAYACYCGRVDVAIELIKLGADTNITDSNGCTPFDTFDGDTSFNDRQRIRNAALASGGGGEVIDMNSL